MKLMIRDYYWLFALVIAPFHSGISAIIFFLLTIFAGYCYFFGNKKQPILTARILSGIFFLYFLYFFVVTYWITGHLLSAYHSMKGNLPMLVMAGYGFFVQESEHNLSANAIGRWATNAVLVTVFFAGILFYWHFFSTNSFPKLLHSTWQGGRLEMFSRNPLMFASLLLVLSSWTVVGFYHSKKSMRLISIVSLFLGWGGVFFMAQSRGALIASIFLMMLIVFYAKPSLKTVFYIITVFLLIFIVAYLNLDWFADLIRKFANRLDYAVGTLFNQKIESSTQTRLMMYKYGIVAFSESPWFGYGYDQRFEAILPFLGYEYKGFMHGHLHNAFLNHAIAGGIFGLLIFCLLLFSPFILLWKYKINYSDEVFLAWNICLAMTTIGMTTAILGHYVHSNFYTALMMTLALLISSNRRAKFP